MDITVTHGYLLTGSGSNVYVQNLCRALVREGHDVNLVCQDPDPMEQDFVNAWLSVNGEGTSPLAGSRETGYPGACTVYRPEIGDLLPVYVYDDYPGWRVKTFLDLTDDELEGYLSSNSAALATVLRETGAESIITNHSVPGPLIAHRATSSLSKEIPYVSIVHGSCLQYVARKSDIYMDVARRGLAGSRYIVSPSPHGATTIVEDFPEMEHKTLALSGGVDTDLFRPDAFDPGILSGLTGGGGRGPKQTGALSYALDNATSEAGLLGSIERVSQSYDPRSYDSDAGERLAGFLDEPGPLIVYVGKLIHSKGVHSLLSAFARIREDTGARLLVIGFGTFREGLEALTTAISNGDGDSLRLLTGLGKRLEGGPAEPMRHFHADDIPAGSSGISASVCFVGPLDHSVLSRILPAADVAVVPSIFPEIFGLVAAEFAASGVVPFVARHSGLAEAGEIVGTGLPFDLGVDMSGFERNLAVAVTDYLGLPDSERREHSGTVRENSVELLSWTTLARQLVELCGPN